MDDQELKAIAGTVAIGSMISLLSVLFLLISALVLGKWHKSYWRMILCLAISDFTVSCSFVAGALPVFLWLKPLSVVPCNLQGLLVQFGSSGTTYYALAIAVVLYLQVVRETKVTPRMEIVLHLLWIPPALLLALLPLYDVGGFHYDNTVGWCWVGEQPTYARFVASYIWVWLVIVSILCLYYSIFSHMRRQAQQIKFARLTEIASGSVYSQQTKSAQRLLLYPLFFIIFWIPATINRTLEAAGYSIYAVTYLECFFLPLQGIANTLIYLFTSEAHKDIMRRFRKRDYTRADFRLSPATTEDWRESPESPLAINNPPHQ